MDTFTRIDWDSSLYYIKMLYLPSKPNCDNSPLALLTEESTLVFCRDRTSDNTLTLLNLGLVKVLETINCFLDVAHVSNTLNLEQPTIVLSFSCCSTSKSLTLEVSVLRQTLTFELTPVCTFLSLDGCCLVSVIGTSFVISRSSKENGPETKDDVSRTELGGSRTWSSNEKGVLALGMKTESSAGRRLQGGS